MLQDLGTIYTGSTPKTNDESLFGGDIPFVTPGDLGEITPIHTATRSLTEEGAKTGTLLPAGAVLVCCIGSLGKIGFAGKPLVTNQQINAVVFDGKKIDPRYGFFACRLLKPQLESMAPATTVPIVNKSRFSELKIPVPPLKEQRRIAAILDQAETLRTQRRTALALLDSLTQSLFLEMFGDPLDNTKRWEWRCMSELFETSPIFGTMIPGEAERGSWLCLRVANIQDWQLTLEDKKYVDLPTSAVERHSVKAGDLLMARAIASQEHLGKCVVAQPGDELWAFDSHLMRLRFRADRAVPEFIRQLLRTPGGRNIFLKASRKSSVQYNINTKEISALEVPVPPSPSNKPSPPASPPSKPSKPPTAAPWPRWMRCLPRCSSGRLRGSCSQPTRTSA
jgi:type I restriction enzyme S subunit